VKFITRAAAVEQDDAIREPLGDDAVPLCDPTAEVLALALDAVRVPADAYGRRVRVYLQDERHVWEQPARRDAVELEDLVQPEAARDALVGERRVDVPVGDHRLPRLECGTDQAADELGARRGEESSLGPRAHLDTLQQQSPHLFAEWRPAGLARPNDIPSFRAQRIGQQLCLRRLSRPVQAFEGDEHGWLTIRRVQAVVTGGAGFIGSHVAEALLARGDEVHVLDDFSHGKPSNIPEGARVHEGDIRRDANTIFDDVEPELCFHLAAQADVRVSVERPDHDADVNVIGTIQVLDTARRHGTKIVFSSTGGAIYGECDGPAPEDHARLPLAPYGTSKLAGEEYLATYNRLYGTSHVSLRYGNVYGPRQDPHGEAGVVAIFMNLLREGGTPKIFGDGRQTRDYVYVGDVVAATLAAVENTGGVFNVGTGRETSVLDLYARIQRASGVRREPEFAPPRAGELQRSVLDPSLAKRDLGWEPKQSLDDGLAETWAWFNSA
jgi:UDP-glucose 4-epimerase